MQRFLKSMALSLTLSSIMYASPVLHDNGVANRANVNSYMEVDTRAFANNIKVAKKAMGNVKICAVIKSDAYGAGISTIMPVLISEKIPCVAITSNEEARITRSLGYKGEVLRIRAATMGEIKDAIKYNVIETIGNLEEAKKLDYLAKSLKRKINIHIKLNSGGMDRNGLDVSWERGKQDAREIFKLKNLVITGLMSHSPYDEVDKVKEIVKKFDRDTDFMIKEGKLDRSKLTLHLANSYGAMQVPEARYDMVRVGYLIYGFESDYVKPTISLKSYVAIINDYPKGSSVSYDGTYTLGRDSRLANIPIGYSNGYFRTLSNKGMVLIRGHKVPVLGRVTMNTMMVDITDFPDIQEGDEVVLYGSQCGNEITLEDMEKNSGTILSELIVLWGKTNPVFVKDYAAHDVCGK